MTITTVTRRQRIRFTAKSFGHTRQVEGVLASKPSPSDTTGRYVFELWLDGQASPAVFSLRPSARVEVVA